MALFTLKNVRKICPVETEQRAVARKVVKPPLRTAEPIDFKQFIVFSCRVP